MGPGAAELATPRPYDELVTWCHTHCERAEEAFAALAYFDVAVLATQARAPALFSVALRDPVCPPSTVFAAYNSYAAGSRTGPDKEIRVWEWNEHERVGAHQQAEQVAWLNDRGLASAFRDGAGLSSVAHSDCRAHGAVAQQE